MVVIITPVVGPSRIVSKTLLFTVRMILSAESVMALQCMDACSIPSSSYTVKMGIIITFKFHLQMKTDSRQQIISLIVFSTGGMSFLCSSEAAISYLVDMWATADQDCLNYLHYHQSDLRASPYSGPTNAINHDMNLEDIGWNLEVLR